MLPLEYEQATDDDGSESGDASSIVDRSLGGFDAAVDAAPWLGEAQTDAIRAKLDVVRAAPDQRLPAAEFEPAVDDAVAAVEDAFGLERTSAG